MFVVLSIYSGIPEQCETYYSLENAINSIINMINNNEYYEIYDNNENKIEITKDNFRDIFEKEDNVWKLKEEYQFEIIDNTHYYIIDTESKKQ